RYRYFDHPLPEPIAALREAFYARLAPVANAWSELLGGPPDAWPDRHADLLARCLAAGQSRPTPLILRYGPGDWNALHQDLYGDVFFPFQVLTVLSEAGTDFEGGELVLVEQRPRAQSRAHVLRPEQGAFVIFPTRERPQAGARGHHRVGMRHGVSTIESGPRTTLGTLFQDAKCPPSRDRPDRTAARPAGQPPRRRSGGSRSSTAARASRSCASPAAAGPSTRPSIARRLWRLPWPSSRSTSPASASASTWPSISAGRAPTGACGRASSRSPTGGPSRTDSLQTRSGAPTRCGRSRRPWGARRSPSSSPATVWSRQTGACAATAAACTASARCSTSSCERPPAIPLARAGGSGSSGCSDSGRALPGGGPAVTPLRGDQALACDQPLALRALRLHQRLHRGVVDVGDDDLPDLVVGGLEDAEPVHAGGLAVVVLRRREVV